MKGGDWWLQKGVVAVWGTYGFVAAVQFNGGVGGWLPIVTAQIHMGMGGIVRG